MSCTDETDPGCWTGQSTIPGTTVAVGGSGGGNSDASSWLSGLGDFLGGAGTFAKDIFAGVNTPTPSTSAWKYNPSTGLYYNSLGQVVTATGQLPTAAGISGGISGNTLLLAFGAILIFFLARKKA